MHNLRLGMSQISYKYLAYSCNIEYWHSFFTTKSGITKNSRIFITVLFVYVHYEILKNNNNYTSLNFKQFIIIIYI